MERMFVACLCFYPGIYWRNWWEKSSWGYLRTIKLITICLCIFGIPDGSKCVLGFAYYVITNYCCIYVCTGSDECGVSWGFCSLIGGPGYVRRGFFVDRTPPHPSTGNWKAREKTTTDVTRTPKKNGPKKQHTLHPNIHVDTTVGRNHFMCESQHTLWAIWDPKCAQAFCY